MVPLFSFANEGHQNPFSSIVIGLLPNFVPAIGEINGLRSNYSFTMIPGEKRVFGNCDMEIEGRKAEPPPDKRGNIARTHFYMDWAYPGVGLYRRKTGNYSRHGIREIRLMYGNVSEAG